MAAVARVAPKQLLATGAGVMNLLNAFHAQGFGAIWLTGGNAYDPEIARERGFDAQERCLGFVYVGSKPPQDNPLPNRPERSAFVHDWSGAIGVVEARCRLPHRT